MTLRVCKSLEDAPGASLVRIHHELPDDPVEIASEVIVALQKLRCYNGFAFTTLESNGLIVELIQNQDAQAVGARGELAVHGMFKAGVIVKDFDQTVAFLKSRGVEIVAGPFPARPDRRANVLVKDNAGNLIQFFGK